MMGSARLLQWTTVAAGDVIREGYASPAKPETEGSMRSLMNQRSKDVREERGRLRREFATAADQGRALFLGQPSAPGEGAFNSYSSFARNRWAAKNLRVQFSILEF